MRIFSVYVYVMNWSSKLTGEVEDGTHEQWSKRRHKRKSEARDFRDNQSIATIDLVGDTAITTTTEEVDAPMNLAVQIRDSEASTIDGEGEPVIQPAGIDILDIAMERTQLIHYNEDGMMGGEKRKTLRNWC